MKVIEVNEELLKLTFNLNTFEKKWANTSVEINDSFFWLAWMHNI